MRCTSLSLLSAFLFLDQVHQAAGIKITRQKTGVKSEVDLAFAPYNPPLPKDAGYNSSYSVLTPRFMNTFELDSSLNKRQSCYPEYINNCAPGYCCSTDHCCPDTGDCLDRSERQCCQGTQCLLSAECCGTGCCNGGKECCGDGGYQTGCCELGSNCYRYDNGPYAGLFTCLTPAEASSVFDEIRGTTTYYASYSYETRDYTTEYTSEYTYYSTSDYTDYYTRDYTSDYTYSTDDYSYSYSYSTPAFTTPAFTAPAFTAPAFPSTTAGGGSSGGDSSGVSGNDSGSNTTAPAAAGNGASGSIHADASSGLLFGSIASMMMFVLGVVFS